MLKRILILAVLAGSVAVTSGAQAAHCVGTQNRATTTLKKVIGYSDETGYELGSETVDILVIADTAGACDDGSVNTTGPLGAPTTLAISGDSNCDATTTSEWDPFGFGAGVHMDISDTSCSIDISWGGFASVYAPDVDNSGASTEGGTLFLGKDTTVSGPESPAVAFVAGVEYRAAPDASGRLLTGLAGS